MRMQEEDGRLHAKERDTEGTSPPNTSGAMRGAVLPHKLQPTLRFGGGLSCIVVIGETASNRSPEEGTELTQRRAGTERALCSEQ